jgi:hypothetical protein
MGASNSNSLKGFLGKDVTVQLKTDKTGSPETVMTGRLVALQGNNMVLQANDCAGKQLTLSLSTYKADPMAPAPGPGSTGSEPYPEPSSEPYPEPMPAPTPTPGPQEGRPPALAGGNKRRSARKQKSQRARKTHHQRAR